MSDFPQPAPIIPNLDAIKGLVGGLAGQAGAIPPPPTMPEPQLPAQPLAPPPPQAPKLPEPAPMGFSTAGSKRVRGGVPVQVAANAQKVYQQEDKKEKAPTKPMGEGLKQPGGWGGGNG